MTLRVGSLVVLVGVFSYGCASQGAAPVQSAPETLSSTTPAGGASMRVYKDPQTGELTDPPPTAATAPAERALNRSHEGLVAVPNTAVPGGGVKLDLQGRFRSHFIATKDADGNVSVRCVPEPELPRP